MIRTIFPQRRTAGSALITTLLVIVVLTIIVTAFLQSMTVERQTSRSYLNRYRADLAAQAGANEAMLMLQGLFAKYPDSVTAWARYPDTEGTIFYFRTNADDESLGSFPPQNTAVQRGLPLISGAVAKVQTELSQDNVFPDGLNGENSVDLNAGDWIGTPPDREDVALRAKWIDLLENPDAPRNDAIDSATGRAFNGPVARYAFWIEDESFRVNVNIAGADPRGGTTPGSEPGEISLAAVAAAGPTAAEAAAMVALRDTLLDQKFLKPSQINYATGAADDDYDNVRFLITSTSSSTNLSRSGARRLNLNDVVSDTTEASEIRTQLDRILSAITNDRALPDFGQRFYQTGFGAAGRLNASGVTAQHAEIYLQKIAANIRDYIDTDSQPTIVENSSDYPVRAIGRPNALSPIGHSVPNNATGDNDVAAIGKEAVPGLQEYALRIKLLSFTDQGDSADYVFELDHYFEFYNSSNEDILIEDLGENPFLLISNQFAWNTGNGEPQIGQGRPVEIPLRSFVDGNGNALTRFPAGDVTVLTTDSDPARKLVERNGVDISTFYRPNAAALGAIANRRVYEGKTTHPRGSKFQISALLGSSAFRAGSPTTDYDTHMLLGNDTGLIESFTALSIPQSLAIHTDTGREFDTDNYFFRGGSLEGNRLNTTGSLSGDPRSLNEQLQIKRYKATPPDSTRFLNSDLNNNAVPGGSTFGVFNFGSEGGYVLPQNWPDTGSATNADQAHAPAVIANAPLKSIGELGHIYDPSRYPATAQNGGIWLSRGGGRTLRIGQPEEYNIRNKVAQFGLWDGQPNSISRNRAAWRLTDVFSTTDALEVPGLINVNSIARDQGAAFRAAVFGFEFGPVPDSPPQIASTEADIDAVVTALRDRFPSATTADPSLDEPFLERGEFSEFDIPEPNVIDRGREELVRRTIELITTKGNVFSAYCVGQALATTRTGVRILSIQRLKVTFALRPVFDPPLPADDTFIPSSEGGIEAGQRFRQPDRFDIEILSTDSI